MSPQQSSGGIGQTIMGMGCGMMAIGCLLTMLVPVLMIGCMAIVGSAVPDNQPVVGEPSRKLPTKRQQPSTSKSPVEAASNPQPAVAREVGSIDQRLQVAADIRHALRDNDVPAFVTAHGTTLTVTYRVAQIKYAPSTFFKDQGQSGIQRIADVGFTEVVIGGLDEDGNSQSKNFNVHRVLDNLEAYRQP